MGHAAALLLLLLLSFISVYVIHMQSNRAVDVTDDCEMTGQKIWQPRIMHVIPQQRRIPMCNMCQALAWRRHLGWFDLCAAQNTLMTNSDSKYHVFAPHLRPGYLTFNQQNGREHTSNAPAL